MLLGVRDAPPAGVRVERIAAGPLDSALLGYRGYHESAPSPSDRWETPSGDVILVVGLADPFLAQELAGVGRPSPFASFVAGLHERPMHTRYQGLQVGVQIRLSPPTAARLLGVPMYELANRVVDLRNLIGDEADRWAAALVAAGTWAQRFARLDEILGERLRVANGRSRLVQQAWDRLRHADGAVRIDDLVAEVGCSHRHLVDMFRRDVGLTPKRAARVLRYESAARKLRGHTDTPAVVAAECGYTDQAHLTREFHRFSGITPAALRAGQISTRP